ncbi:hypothetical protein Sango_1180900 [Sesamum angolense]|uniref:Integrase catalytic domain-containing protein n=1 Tax=Sesamum angolense TaxID=2727404 RepID=A0AAE1WW06_9LAMI|nr:hypothetical protein Sango_1180900 [Sesamum angolense]
MRLLVSLKCRRSQPQLDHVEGNYPQWGDEQRMDWAQMMIFDAAGPSYFASSHEGVLMMTVIWVVVDRLSKFTHFFSLPMSFKAATLACFFLKEIYRLHWAPRVIVSDHDHLFLSTFWRELFRLFGTTLGYSSSYHPQSGGQTKVFLCGSLDWHRGLQTRLAGGVADPPCLSRLVAQALQLCSNRSDLPTPFYGYYDTFTSVCLDLDVAAIQDFFPLGLEDKPPFAGGGNDMSNEEAQPNEPQQGDNRPRRVILKPTCYLG